MTHSLSIPPRAWAGIAMLSLIWGGSFLAIRIALDEVPVATLVALRVGGSALALWLFVLAARMPLPRRPGAWAALAMMGMLNNAIPFTLITWGQQYIASGLAAILNAATAIFGVLAAAMLLKDERMTPRKGIGVALGFCGVATAIGLGNLAQFDPTSLAQIALLGAALSYALASVWARRMLQGIAPEVAAAGMTSMAALFLVPWALWLDGMPGFAWSARGWGALAYLALVASALAYILYYRILALAGAANVSVTTLLVAPIAIVLGALVLGETLPPSAYAGFAMLALGLVILDGRLWRRLSGRERVAAE